MTMLKIKYTDITTKYKPNNCNNMQIIVVLKEMTPIEEAALEKVYYLTNNVTRNWRKLLKFGESLDLELKRTLLWIWPTEKELSQMGKILSDLNISCILSIGCGCGLFEWLLKESLNIETYGLEVNRNWWSSKYAIKSFITLNYIEDMVTLEGVDLLRNCCLQDKYKFAIMFCYFNNRSAFLQYLNVYKGHWIIIIGPIGIGKRNIYTDPMPLEPNFPDDTTWLLRCTLNIGDNDVLAVYEKSNEIG